MSIYMDNGYNDRKEYLEALAEEYEMPFENVLALAQVLGPEEDFDGLVVAVQDGA